MKEKIKQKEERALLFLEINPEEIAERDC